MWTTDEFATGFVPTWDSGITFSGEYDEESDWIHNLQIHNQFIDPIVLVIVNRTSQEGSADPQPHLIRDYFSWSEGFRVGDSLGIPQPDIEELVEAFSRTTSEELEAVLRDDKTIEVEDCLRCINAIQRFISEVLASGSSVFIQSW